MAGTRLATAKSCGSTQQHNSLGVVETPSPSKTSVTSTVRLSKTLCPRPRQALFYPWIPLVVIALLLVYVGRWRQDETWLVYQEGNDGQIPIKKLPQCVIIGVRKCGTRALLEFLNLHPQIEVAKDEMHFFDKSPRYKFGLEWYREQMPPTYPRQVTIEKSPAYFITEGVPERIQSMNSSIKLLIIIRDPTVRTVSDYTQIYSNRHARNESFPSFESLVLDSKGDVTTLYKAVRISLYDYHMRRWLRVFNRDQIHIVDGDKLVSEPASELYEVENFLGLDHFLNEEKFYFNKTRGFYCMRNHTGYRCLGASKGRRHPEVADQVLDKLRTFFRPHNELFFNMTGRMFDWT